jgi:hypothetical protein
MRFGTIAESLYGPEDVRCPEITYSGFTNSYEVPYTQGYVPVPVGLGMTTGMPLTIEVVDGAAQKTTCRATISFPH